MSSVAVLEFDRLGTNGKSYELVTKTNAHDRDLGIIHQLTEAVDRLLTMGWVSRPVGDEDAVKVVGDFVDGIVEGETSHARAAADEGAENVFFYTTIYDGDVEVTGAADVERTLGADTAHEVDLLGVHKGLILVLVVLSDIYVSIES